MTNKMNKMNQLQTIALSDKLREVCKMLDGGAVYAEGWSDEHVLKIMGSAYNLQNVASLRRVMFGNIKGKSRDVTIQELVARIEHLESWASERPVQRFHRKE
jgi:hypothetical protein